jgi:prepilin-type N-terminal cleavage/methylation domain-containing protein
VSTYPLSIRLDPQKKEVKNLIRAFSKARNHKGFTLLELLVVAAIIAIIAAIAIPQLLNAKRSAWESRAKATLRSYGETELAYQNTNNDRQWGSWDALVKTEYIAGGYTMGKLIENYSVYTVASNPVKQEGGIGLGENTFTVVAFPRVTRPAGYLSTFAIREDETLRVYRPNTPGVKAWGVDDDYGTKSWEPIR